MSSLPPRPVLEHELDSQTSTTDEGQVSPRVERLARLVLRPIGSPLPLGFAALGAASIVLSGLQLQWLPISEAHQVALVMLVFAVPLQLLASVFGFLARDSVGGTGMGVLAGTWLVIGSVVITSPPGSSSRTLGLLLFFAAAVLMIPTAAAVLGKVAAAIVMFAAAGRFALTGIYEFHRQDGLGSSLRLVGTWVVSCRPLRRVGVRTRGHRAAHDPSGGSARRWPTGPSRWHRRRSRRPAARGRGEGTALTWEVPGTRCGFSEALSSIPDL